MVPDVGRETREIPDFPREHDVALGQPAVRATSFAHTAVRSVQRKSRFVRDARMFCKPRLSFTRETREFGHEFSDCRIQVAANRTAMNVAPRQSETRTC